MSHEIQNGDFMRSIRPDLTERMCTLLNMYIQLEDRAQSMFPESPQLQYDWKLLPLDFNCILSGSVVLQAITGSIYPNSDIDIFCNSYHFKKKCQIFETNFPTFKKIRESITNTSNMEFPTEALYRMDKRMPRVRTYKCWRSNTCVDFVEVPDRYNLLHDIVGSFDFDCVQMAYAGNDEWFAKTPQMLCTVTTRSKQYAHVVDPAMLEVLEKFSLPSNYTFLDHLTKHFHDIVKQHWLKHDPNSSIQYQFFVGDSIVGLKRKSISVTQKGAFMWLTRLVCRIFKYQSRIPFNFGSVESTTRILNLVNCFVKKNPELLCFESNREEHYFQRWESVCLELSIVQPYVPIVDKL